MFVITGIYEHYTYSRLCVSEGLMIITHVAICIYIMFIVTAIYEHYTYSRLRVSEGLIIVAHMAICIISCLLSLQFMSTIRTAVCVSVRG